MRCGLIRQQKPLKRLILNFKLLNVNIKTDLETISLNESTIFGQLYFQDGDFYFPSKDWNEFIIIVLNWWCQSLLNLLEEKTFSEELDFMDGPFSVRVNLIEGSIYNFYFKKDDEILKKDEVDLLSFTKEFLKQVNALLRYTANFNIINDCELDSLKNNYNKLQSKLKAT